MGGHDDGVVAAELEDRPPEALVHHLADAVAHPAAPGGGDQRHARVGQQLLADRAPSADDEAEDRRVHVVGPAHLLRDARAGDGGERRLRGRLPEGGVAADRGEGRVPGPDRHREVEGGDDAHDPQRVPLLVHAVAGPLGVHGQAVELPREADGEVADVDHLLDLALALGADLAHLQRDQGAQGFLELPEGVSELADHLAALGGGKLAPAEEGLLGPPRHPVVLLGGDLGDPRQERSRRWGSGPPAGRRCRASLRRTRRGCPPRCRVASGFLSSLPPGRSVTDRF